MANRQPPKRLFKGRDHISAYQTAQSPMKLMKQVSRDHLDVLQNIESMLASRHREDPGVDDRTASAALRACMSGVEPDDPRVAELTATLRSVRQLREDVTEEVWQKALRVVEDSVRTHSDLAPGATDYFRFIEAYV